MNNNSHLPIFFAANKNKDNAKVALVTGNNAFITRWKETKTAVV